MVSRRALDVLRVIVEDYVASREPVGSKSIVGRNASSPLRSSCSRTTCSWRDRVQTANHAVVGRAAREPDGAVRPAVAAVGSCVGNALEGL